ncbi:MAG: hypothetical protein H7Y17_15580 [Chlorobia bacterium]|nr:hypothetical protein [Fimbriimonadaceae bacterium]
MLVVGFVALWIESAYCFGAVFGGFDEPFPTVEDYFRAVGSTSIAGTCIWFFLLSGLAVIHYLLILCQRRPRWDELARTAILMFVPTVVWATIRTLSEANSAYLSLMTPAPAWMDHPLIHFFGSEWILLILFVTCLAHWAWQLTAALKTTRVPKELAS